MADKNEYQPKFLHIPPEADLPHTYSFAHFCTSARRLGLSRNDYRKRFTDTNGHQVELIALRPDWRDSPFVCLDTNTGQVFAFSRSYRREIRLAPVRHQRTPDHAAVIEELTQPVVGMALFPPDVVQPETWEYRFQSALRSSDVTPDEAGGLAIHSESTSRGGDFYLFVEEHHTAADVRAAEAYIRKRSDVAAIWIVSLPMVDLHALTLPGGARENAQPLPLAINTSNAMNQQLSKTQVGTVDLTPEWKGLLPALIELASNGQRAATDELYRLADFADRVGPHWTAVFNAAKAVAEELKKSSVVAPESRALLVEAVANFEAAEAKRAGSNSSPLPSQPTKQAQRGAGRS